uniref:Uncharacterized protein n=1 Tax=Daphnia galeata TaxID=27404 RepID=A0A8J2RQ40_9CRUS|nr:unnamed protein product [Daphnia galeata]
MELLTLRLLAEERRMDAVKREIQEPSSSKPVEALAVTNQYRRGYYRCGRYKSNNRWQAATDNLKRNKTIGGKGKISFMVFTTALFHLKNAEIIRKTKGRKVINMLNIIVQNAAARLIKGAKKCDLISPILLDLHWLPIALRIDFKIALLTYRCLHCLDPRYLTSLLRLPVSSRLAYVCFQLWNSLSQNVRIASSLAQFRSRLKTDLITVAFRDTMETTEVNDGWYIDSGATCHMSAIPKPEHNTLVVRQTAPLTTCHERLGHVATKTVQIMASRNVVYGLYSGDTSITTDAMVACIEKGIEDIT